MTGMTPATDAEVPLILTGGRVLADDGPVEATVVDIHIHGAAGHSFEQAEDDDGAAAILHHIASRGVITVLASLASDQIDTLVSAVGALHARRDHSLPGAAELAGVHLEGPFLAPAQAGAH